MTSFKNLKKSRLRELGFFTILIIIPIIHFCVFWIGVNINSFALAFEGKNGFTLQYFELFFQELFMSNASNTLIQGFQNTLTIFAINILVIFPISVIFSYFLYKKIFMYKCFRIIFFLPSIISSVVLVTLFKNVMEGPISLMFQNLFNMEFAPLFFDSTQYAFKSIITYNIWLGLASNMVIYSGTMSRIPAEIIESAKIDGISYFGELIRMVLPLMWPTLSVIILLNVVGIFTADGPILLMTQGQYGTYTLGYWFYDKTIVNPNLNYGAAVGLAFTMFSVPITLLARWLVNRVDTQVEF